jgi:serine/threonine-protein kinase RsbW
VGNGFNVHATRSAAADEAPVSGAAEGHAVRLTIPAKPEYITLCRLALTGLARLRPLSEETLGDLKLALTEACSNSVRHAYAEGRSGTVEILYELREDRLVVEVADEGPGFEPPESSEKEPGVNEGGLGIAIIRALADELEIGGRENGRGSRLRFVKFLES